MPTKFYSSPILTPLPVEASLLYAPSGWYNAKHCQIEGWNLLVAASLTLEVMKKMCILSLKFSILQSDVLEAFKEKHCKYRLSQSQFSLVHKSIDISPSLGQAMWQDPVNQKHTGFWHLSSQRLLLITCRRNILAFSLILFSTPVSINI